MSPLRWTSSATLFGLRASTLLIWSIDSTVRPLIASKTSPAWMPARAAARAGIQAGDVLLAINGRTVESIDQIKSVLARKPKSVALLVQRNGDKIFVPVKVG